MSCHYIGKIKRNKNPELCCDRTQKQYYILILPDYPYHPRARSARRVYILLFCSSCFWIFLLKLVPFRAPAKVPKFLFCLNLAPNSAAVFFSCCVRAHRFSDITSQPYVPYQDIPAMVCPGWGVPGNSVPGNSVPDSGVPGQSVPRPKYSPPFKLIYAFFGGGDILVLRILILYCTKTSPDQKSPEVIYSN